MRLNYLILPFFLLGLTFNSYSQIKAGVVLGGNSSVFLHGTTSYTLHGGGQQHSIDFSEKFRMRGMIGGYVSFPLSKNFKLNTEIAYNSRAARSPDYYIIDIAKKYYPDLIDVYSVRIAVAAKYEFSKQRFFVTFGFVNDWIVDRQDQWTNPEQMINYPLQNAFIYFGKYVNPSGHLGVGFTYKQFSFSVNEYISALSSYMNTIEIKTSFNMVGLKK